MQFQIIYISSQLATFYTTFTLGLSHTM